MAKTENDEQATTVLTQDNKDATAEEDEIHLLDLFIVLLKHKVMIISIVFLTGIAAVAYSLYLPNIYRSEAVIAPTTQEKGIGAFAALDGLRAMISTEAGTGVSGSISQFNLTLKSREFSHSIIRKHNLMPVLFADSWDEKNKRWRAAKPPVFDDAYDKIHDLFKIAPDNKQNVLRLSFEYDDPQTAQTMLNYYITELSEFLRKETLEEVATQKTHLARQLAMTTDPLLKNILIQLIGKQIIKETQSKIMKYFSFTVIDPAFVPEKKVKPERAQIVASSVAVAFFLAIFLAFFLEYARNLKTREDPERLANLRRSWKLRF
ncbi:MAG: Wzz/FepE/Etk N-terminal domain-containing protein [Smithellaceae bacterium]|nr:Wzz/FepE/Etk N-terminal domain-containing protein [Smithellaceae bacterium]